MKVGRPRRWVQAVLLTSVLAVIATVACFALLGSCAYLYRDPYVPPAAQIPGQWCSAAGDVLTLDPDSTFTVNHLSRPFLDDLLPAPGYIAGYRIKTELGGTAPDTADGTWQEIPAHNDVDPDSPPNRGVWLTLSKVGTHPEHDALTLYFDGDKGSWGFSLDHNDGTLHWFDRCPSAK
jgi:hypothetical protein